MSRFPQQNCIFEFISFYRTFVRNFLKNGRGKEHGDEQIFKTENGIFVSILKIQKVQILAMKLTFLNIQFFVKIRSRGVNTCSR